MDKDELEKEFMDAKSKDDLEEEQEQKVIEKPEVSVEGSLIFALRTTANREDQVMDFISSNVSKKNEKGGKLEVYSLVRPHGMRGYIFLEAKNRQDAETAVFKIPYARGLLPKEVQYSEIENMLEPAKKVEVNIKKNDIVEIIAGPFKREQAKISRIDKIKEEVVVELLDAAVPIPVTLKMDAVKVIRRESDESSQEDNSDD